MRDDRGKRVKLRKTKKAWHVRASGSYVSLVILGVPTLVVSVMLTNTLIYAFVMFSVVLLILFIFNGAVMPKQVRPSLYGGHPNSSNVVVSCKACEYPLSSVVIDVDGFVICPECGAAWKLESPDA